MAKEHIMSANLRARALAMALFGVAVVLVFVQDNAYAQEKPILDQVRDIVTSDDGTVRKWVTPPKLVVFYDQDSYEDEITALVEEINGKVIGFPGISEVDFFNVGQFEEYLFSGVLFGARGTQVGDGELSTSMLTIVVPNPNRILGKSGDIFVFITNTKTGALFGEIVGANNAAHLRRRYVENTADTTCYMNVQSLNNELQIGWVFINSNNTREAVRHCIHHEVTHVLGALHHTEWSSFFTHNDNSGPMLTTDADFDLLSALYNESIHAGDSADGVVKEFEFIINNKE